MTGRRRWTETGYSAGLEPRLSGRMAESDRPSLHRALLHLPWHHPNAGTEIHSVDKALSSMRVAMFVVYKRCHRMWQSPRIHQQAGSGHFGRTRHCLWPYSLPVFPHTGRAWRTSRYSSRPRNPTGLTRSGPHTGCPDRMHTSVDQIERMRCHRRSCHICRPCTAWIERRTPALPHRSCHPSGRHRRART